MDMYLLYSSIRESEERGEWELLYQGSPPHTLSSSLLEHHSYQCQATFGGLDNQWPEFWWYTGGEGWAGCSDFCSVQRSTESGFLFQFCIAEALARWEMWLLLTPYSAWRYGALQWINVQYCKLIEPLPELALYSPLFTQSISVQNYGLWML